MAKSRLSDPTSLLEFQTEVGMQEGSDVRRQEVQYSAYLRNVWLARDVLAGKILLKWKLFGEIMKGRLVLHRNLVCVCVCVC